MSHPVSASPEEEYSEEGDQRGDAEEKDEEAALQVSWLLFLQLWPFLIQEVKEGLEQVSLVDQQTGLIVLHVVFQIQKILLTMFKVAAHADGCSCFTSIHVVEG